MTNQLQPIDGVDYTVHEHVTVHPPGNDGGIVVRGTDDRCPFSWSYPSDPAYPWFLARVGQQVTYHEDHWGEETYYDEAEIVFDPPATDHVWVRNEGYRKYREHDMPWSSRGPVREVPKAQLDAYREALTALAEATNVLHEHFDRRLTFDDPDIDD
jgi:hypothetical protein